MSSEKRNQTIVFLMLFIFVLFLLWLMIKPFLSPAIFALIIAGAFYPFVRYIMERFRWSRTVCAAIACLLIFLVVFLPIIYISVRLAQETVAAYNRIQSPETEKAIRNLFLGEGYIAGLLKEGYEFIYPGKIYDIENLRALILEGGKKLSGAILSMANSWVSNTFNFIFQFVVMLMIIFAVLRDGPTLKAFLLRLSPLPDKDEELIIRKFNEINYVTMVANTAGGVLQGGLAGIAFAFAGIGSPLLWTVLMILLAFIPLAGMSIVYIPVTLYLMAVGSYWTAGILFLFCTTVALLVEYWFKPALMGNRTRINSLLVFLSIIGGMGAFGMAGIFYGPLIVAIFLTLTALYEETYSAMFKNL